MLKIIAVLLNIGVLVFVISLLVEEGLPDEGVVILLVLFLISAPLVNLFVIIWDKEDNWFSLYFKRKAMEEKQKIAEIEKESK